MQCCILGETPKWKRRLQARSEGKTGRRRQKGEARLDRTAHKLKQQKGVNWARLPTHVEKKMGKSAQHDMVAFQSTWAKVTTNKWNNTTKPTRAHGPLVGSSKCHLKVHWWLRDSADTKPPTTHKQSPHPSRKATNSSSPQVGNAVERHCVACAAMRARVCKWRL